MKEFFGGIWLKIIYLSIAVIVIISVAVSGSARINRIEEEKCWQTLEKSAEAISRELMLCISDNQNVLHLAGKAIERGDMLKDKTALASYIMSIQEMTVFERIEVIYPDHTILFSDGTSYTLSKDFLYTELTLLGEHLSIRMTDLYDANSQVVNYFVPVKNGKETVAILVGIIACDTLEDVMDKLNTKFWYSTMQDVSEEDYSHYVESLIRRTDVPVKAVLGNSIITVNDFANLQCGDIVRLDTGAESELSVYVGNIKKFMAMPGKSGDKYAVRVTSVIREEE